MLIIPELQTVVILVPRTGTNYIKKAVAERYPQSTLLYRHMEADGVPFGYDHYHRVGVVRDPIDRLWSLYKYLRDYNLDACAPYKRAYMRSLQASTVALPFATWLHVNNMPIATPFGSEGGYHPQSAVMHILPEPVKSQYIYLRPDLGTEVIRYPDIGELLRRLDIPDKRTHVTSDVPVPELSEQDMLRLRCNLMWDFKQFPERYAA